MQIVILAGGKGTRLGDLTKAIPKPMIDVDGKPFLELLINYLCKQGFEDFHIILGYLPDYIPAYFGDGSQWNCRITYSGDENNLMVGTAGALLNAKNHLADQFILLFGDTLLPINYVEFAQYFKQKRLKALLAVYDNKQNTDVVCNIDLGKEDQVLKYLKNSQQKLHFVDAGVLAFDKKVIDLIKPNQELSLEEDIYPKLISQNELFAFKTSERFYDIGTPARLAIFKRYFYDHFQNASQN